MSGLQGWLDKVTPALQIVIIRYLLGDFNKGNNRMNSSSGSRCSILDFILAVVVTLGRCERCWSGALSRNSHRGSINLWCPADKRPTDRLGAVTLGNIPRVAFSCSWVNICQTLTHSLLSAVVHKTTHGGQSIGGLPPNAPWDWLPCSCGWVVCQLSLLEWVRVGVWH